VKHKSVALPAGVGLLMLAIATLFALFSQPYIQAQQNILGNPGFEGGWYDIVIGQVPNSYKWQWADGVKLPGGHHNTCAPESRVLPKSQVPASEQSLYFKDGNQCIKIFKGGCPVYAALTQDLKNLEVGRQYRFVVPIYVDVFDWENKKVAPTDPFDAMIRLGAGPKGASWQDENAVTFSGWWSGENVGMDNFFLHWVEPSFEFVATAPDMTVYVVLAAKWGMDNNGFFLDGLGLYPQEVVETPTPTNPPPPPTPTYGPSPTPRNTPTPRPDGATVHIVESGDTLFGIALTYNVPVDQLRTLNAGSLGANDLIRVGQELVISLPSQAPTSTPLPEPPTVEPVGVATSEAEPPPGEGASICVVAYHDRNNNTFRDDEETEELLPNAEFTIADASGVVARHTSDGVHEPHCFTGLVPGTYRVIVSPPAGYATSSPAEWPVAVADRTSLSIQFGHVRGDGPLPEEATVTPEPGEESTSNAGATVRRIFSTIAKISGIVVLLLAAGVAALFVINRRRM
jgi:LysM repeat protein